MVHRLGYEHLALVHRVNHAFDAAEVCCETARLLLATERGQNGEDAARMEAFFALRNELDRTGFAWSEDLEGYCRQVGREDELLFGLRDNALTLAIAGYIIAEHRGDAPGMADAAERMRRLLHDDALTAAERMYQRHRVDPRVSLTDGESAFLSRIGVL